MRNAALFIIMLSVSAANATEMQDWISSSNYRGCMYNDEDWHCKPTQLPNFTPLGFSSDGWFAWVTGPWGNTVEFEGPYCPNPPCAGIILKNLLCDGDCLSDSPSSPNDKCYCPIGATINELKAFRIQPVAEKIRNGCFPAELNGDEYSVEFNYKEKLIYSEMMEIGKKPKPELPGTEVILVSKKKGRKRIDVINHSHGGLFPRTAQATGWMETPYPNRIIVVIEGGTSVNSDGYPTAVINRIIPVDLSKGFR